MRRRQHDSVDIIVLTAFDADEPKRTVTLDVVRMVCPRGGGQGGDFLAQSPHVESHGQSVEWLVELHWCGRGGLRPPVVSLGSFNRLAKIPDPPGQLPKGGPFGV